MKDLNSRIDSKVSLALDLALEKGDVKWVRPLLYAFRDRKDDELRVRMSEILSTIKLSGAEDIYIEELENNESSSIHADILGFIWSAGFDASNKLDLVTRVATTGDFRVAMEGLTIIEQCESIEEEHVLLDAILNVRTAIENTDDESVKSLYEPMLASLLKLERNQ